MKLYSVIITAAHVFEHLFTYVTSGLDRVVQVFVMPHCIAFATEFVATVQAEKQAAIFGYSLWFRLCMREKENSFRNCLTS